MNELFGAERKCPVCGKVYIVTCSPDEWGFAYGAQLVCSYHCMRQREREDKRRPKIDGPAAALYKRMMLGKRSGDLIKSNLAIKEKLRSKQELRSFVDDWVAANPKAAQQIREEAQIQLTHFRQVDVAGMAGVDSTCVREHALTLGITGKRICGRVYYTQQEADAIIAAMGVTA